MTTSEAPMSDPEDHLMTVFTAALDCSSAAERAAYLDQACAGDPGLRERVEALLRAHAQAGGFLGRAELEGTGGFEPAAERGTLAAGLAAGAVVAGRYKLLEQIGEGGMGEVWLAEQTKPVRRKVALKLIKPGMDSRQVLARFEQERQALALMDHPNIARVLDAGATEAGRPFFVMELVKGVPITRHCDDHKLTLRERLGLFAQVCAAVQHAHQKGVIHRDIKPSNVLIAPYDGVPVPKVIDFGVAKAAGQPLTEMTLFTGIGAVVGTPEYMSPEQAELNNADIDTRSDVYSLGVLLYELLTGTTPLTRKRLREAALLEVLRLVREEEPPRPSTRLSTTDELPAVAANRGLEPRKLSGLVRGELDWIVMKALEKDRNRRYESANGFAQDVRRYLADEPVQACPPSAWYRFRKFGRRNKTALTTTAVIVLALLLATAVSTWQAVQATVARKDADTNADIADGHRRVAEASQKDMQITLADMNTTQGLMADERGHPAQAVLWFANAARLAEKDAQRETANRVRVRNWGRKVLTPVANILTSGHIRTLAFHPRSDCLLATTTGEFILWDVRKDEALPLPGKRGAVGAAVWSPDGGLLAVGDAAGQVEVFEFPSRRLLHRITQPGPIRALAFNAEGSRLALAAQAVRVWEVRSQTFVKGEPAHPQAVETLLFNARGDRLVTGCRDNHARVFTVGEKEVAAEPLFAPVAHIWCPDEQDHRRGVPCGPAYVDGGRALLTRADRVSAAWWDAETGQLVRRLSAPPAPSIWHPTLAADPPGRYAVLAGGSSSQVWDTVTARSVASLPMLHCIMSASFSGDGRVLLTGSLAGTNTFRMWSLPEGRLLAEQDLHGGVGATALSADGRLLTAGTGWGGGGIIRVYCAAEGNPSRPATPVWAAPAGPASDSWIKLSRDGRHVISSGWVMTVKHLSGARTQVHEVETGQPVGAPLRAPGPILNADFSPDGQRVVLAAYRPESAAVDAGVVCEVSFRDWRTGKHVFPPASLPTSPTHLCCSPDGTRLAVIGREGKVFLLDAATGKVRATFQSEEFQIKPDFVIARHVGLHRVGFDPDGKHLLAWGKAKETAPPDARQVRVWDLGTGRMRTLRPMHRSWFGDVQFSADGRLCTAGGTVWDFASGQALARLPAHPSLVFMSRFSPDGRRIATACSDGMVRLWDWRTGRLVCPPFQHTHEAWDVAFTPDGLRVATTGTDQTVRLWDVQTGQQLAPAIGLPARGCQLETDPTGRFLVVSGEFPSIPAFDLQEMCRTDDLPLDDLCLWGELVSGQRIHEGGNVVNLAPDEWLSRWRSFRQRHPARLDAVWHTQSKRAWRRREAEGRRALGSDLRGKGRLDDAIVVYRQALALWPEDARAHHELGGALYHKGQWPEATAAYRDAVRLRPASSEYRYDLGNAQRQAGELDEARASFEEAIRLDPEFPEAHCNLGFALLAQGRFADALRARKRGHELGSRSPAWPYRSEQWVRHCERHIELERRLPAVLRGQEKPGPAERAEFAQACHLLRRHAEAARLYEEAFAAAPALAGADPSAARYTAACAAAQAGCGGGTGAAHLDEEARARWRNQALAWLRAELAARLGSLQKAAPASRGAMLAALNGWLYEPHLAGVREEKSLGKLPQKEREAWQGFWADVAKAQEPAGN
jgi:serine/threonine protein kinase/WD40 repeat protein/tetratricopeptide (TPR) repeat protein